MVNVITTVYSTLIDMVETEMPNVGMCKSDTEDFEIHPAIGFGLPLIGDPLLVSNVDEVLLSIPVVIQDYGAADGVTIKVLDLYEEFRTVLQTKLLDYLALQSLNPSSVVINEFQKNTAIIDPSIRGLIGSINITIKL